MGRLPSSTVAALAAGLMTILGPAVRPAAANPESEALRARAADELYNLDRDKALATFRAAIAADPEDADAHRGLAGALWLAETFRRGTMTVDNYMGRVSRQNVKVPPPPPETATAFTTAVEKAISLARARVVAAPSDAEARYELGAAVGLRASYTATIEGSVRAAFGSAREAFNEHEQVLQLDGRRLDAGLIVGTYRYLVASLALPVRWMAYMAGFGGDKEKGLQLIESAAGYEGDNQADARFALVLLYNRENRFDDALRQLDALQKRYPRNRLLWLEAGSTALRAGRAQVASRYLEDGMTRLAGDNRPRMYGEEALWFHKRGLARAWMGGRDAEAEADLRRSLASESYLWVRGRSHLELGRMFLKAGDRAKARTELTAAVPLLQSSGDAGPLGEANEMLRKIQ
jgi:tetratricopeptide (TPR) repeat protein